MGGWQVTGQAPGAAACGATGVLPRACRARRAPRGQQRRARRAAGPRPAHQQPRGASRPAGKVRAGALRGHRTDKQARRARRGGRAAQGGGGAAHWALRMSISVLQLWCSQCLPTCFSASARASSSCARAQPRTHEMQLPTQSTLARAVPRRARAPAARFVGVLGSGPGRRCAGRQAAALLAGAEPCTCQAPRAGLPRLCSCALDGARHLSGHI